MLLQKKEIFRWYFLFFVFSCIAHTEVLVEQIFSDETKSGSLVDKNPSFGFSGGWHFNPIKPEPKAQIKEKMLILFESNTTFIIRDFSKIDILDYPDGIYLRTHLSTIVPFIAEVNLSFLVDFSNERVVGSNDIVELFFGINSMKEKPISMTFSGATSSSVSGSKKLIDGGGIEGENDFILKFIFTEKNEMQVSMWHNSEDLTSPPHIIVSKKVASSKLWHFTYFLINKSQDGLMPSLEGSMGCRFIRVATTPEEILKPVN